MLEKYILILTQDTNNASANMLKEEAQKYKNYVTIAWDVNKVVLSNTHIKADKFSEISSSIAISQIRLVIKRTWSPIRTKALGICKGLENMGVMVLNGCALIEWSHSKITQYKTLKENIFPKSVCFDKQFLESMRNKSSEEFAKTVLVTCKKTGLSFPMIFKTDEGCRGDGVFLIESYEALKDALTYLLSLNKNGKGAEFRKGFLVQQFIQTHPNIYVSTYWRINIVGGKAQSAVQFQMKWVSSNKSTYKVLVDFAEDEEDEEMPIDLSFFPKDQLAKIIAACPYNQEVMGVDVLSSINAKEWRLYPLEWNDGPVVSAIVELGKKYKNDPIYGKAAEACLNFPAEIMKLCFHMIHIYEICVLSSQEKERSVAIPSKL